MKIALFSAIYILLLCCFCLTSTWAQFYQRRTEAQRVQNYYQNYLQQLLYRSRTGGSFNNPPYYTTPRPRTRSSKKVQTITTTTTTEKPKPASSPASRLAAIIERSGGNCGLRTSSYLPHKKRVQSSEVRPRRGRIVWEDDDSMGAAVAPKGSFPWMVSLFVLLKNGEALFMCAGALITPNLAVTAAHCFTNNEKKTTWFARVGDNYILKSDPEEQTFRVSKIVKHGNFKPLGSGVDGDGRNDIALVVLQPHRNSRDLYGSSNQVDGLVKFGQDVAPICVLPQSDYPLPKLTPQHCEIAGWGMTEYNNTNSYPDSVRAARITVGDVSDTFCNYLYKRNVYNTGKFCAGYGVDACQEDSGGPLVCQLEDEKYHLVGIVSSGKGCGIYPGLYTDVSRYMDWLAYWVEKESV